MSATVEQWAKLQRIDPGFHACCESRFPRDVMDEDKKKRRVWLCDHAICCICGGNPLVESEAALQCSKCNAEFSILNDAVNFISEEARTAFGISPTENVSAHQYDDIAMGLIDDGGMVLDCGSGKKDVTFPNLIQCEVVEYPNVDVLAVNQALPFRDACFDAVLSLDVLEHVDQPFDCAAEILRVLKPGGTLYCNVPFLQREHGYPHHYFGMTRMGLRRLFGDQIQVDAHKVPASGHPMWALWMMLQTYRDGLPADLRHHFHQLRVADILDKNPAEWMKEPVFTELNEEARWKIATTTSLVATKRKKKN